jgi:chromatin remodeling complex protein RSC6
MATAKKKSARKSAKKSTRKTARKAARKTTRRPAARKTAKKPARKPARKTAARKAARKPAKKAARKKTARKPNAAFMKPMQPDAALGAVVGNSPMPRTEITKKLWGYIKRNGLQDARERRMINADDKLRQVFNGKGRVSMFDMTKLVNQHLG